MRTEDELFDLLSRDPSKIQNLCRICLCEDPCNATPLFNENVTDDGECKVTPSSDEFTAVGVCEKLMMCGHVKVYSEDKLPKLICRPCQYDLDIAHLFRIKCQRADMLLRKVLDSMSNFIKEEQERHFDNEPIIAIEKNNKLLSTIDDSIEEIKKECIESDNDLIFNDGELIECDVPNIVKKKRKRKLLKSNAVDGTGDKFNICLDDDKTTCDVKFCIDLNIKNDDKYMCELCNKALSTKYVFIKHMKTFHGENRKVATKEKEEWLVTGKGDEKRFHCPECDYKCRRRQGLQYHMATHTGARPFKCDECPQTFTQHGRLYAHKKSHSDKTYFTCAECGKQFKHKDSFNKHKNVHNSELNFVCHICNKGLKSQKTLNEHINRHLQIKKFSCEFCGLAFVTKVDLLQHLRVHNDERKHKCTFCSYSSYSKGTLDVHIKRHTGERNFHCEYCNYTCFTRGTLKFHIRKHTKEQNYACPICDMKFRQSTSVNSHMLKKHGEKFKWSDTVDRRVVK